MKYAVIGDFFGFSDQCIGNESAEDKAECNFLESGQYGDYQDRQGGPYRRQFVVFTADSDSRDVRLLNKQPGLSGMVSNDKHLLYRRRISS